MGRLVLCKVGELEEGASKQLDCGRDSVAVFCIGGRYYACSDACPHAGGPLHQGFLSGAVVTCPWHGWSFDLAQSTEAARDGVDRFPVRIEGDEVVIDYPV